MSKKKSDLSSGIEMSLDDISNHTGSSVFKVHYQLKKIINKMVDRLKPEADQCGMSVFEIVLYISEYLCVEPDEIYKQLNEINMGLVRAHAYKMNPGMADDAIRESGYEPIL